MKSAEKNVLKLCEIALRRFSMIADGDRILIAVSGGKDSLSLAYCLSQIKKWWPGFEIHAVHISSDFCNCSQKASLYNLLENWGLEYTDVFVPIIGRLKDGKKMNCYWCSTQRRTELIRFALDKGYNKIALGHHLDDIVETLFMNMMHKSQLSSMKPALKYDKYPITLLRPLAMCEEKQIIDFIHEKEIHRTVCTCIHGKNSLRLEVRAKIAQLTEGSGQRKRAIFASLSNIKPEYL